MQAPNPIGFDKHVRCQVESNICQPIDKQNNFSYLIDIYSDCFYLPMLIVYNVLEKIFLPKFLKSKLYAKFMNELFDNSTIKKEENFKSPNVKNRLPMSLRSSNHDGGYEPLIKKKETNENELNDPLWKRPQAKEKLTIGRIDEMGRYIREVESSEFYEISLKSPNEKAKSEDTVSTSSLKKPFNKLMNLINVNVNGNKNKNEEEMAIKVAQMLINDVVKANENL